MKIKASLLSLAMALACQLTFGQTNSSSSSGNNSNGSNSNNTGTSTASTSNSGNGDMQGNNSGKSKPMNTDPATMDFITTATAANLKEVATGKIASKKGQDPSVKAFGDKMVDHHTMATKEMAALVKSKKIHVTKPSMEMAAPDSSLIKSSGAEFDRMYVTAMIADHKKNIALFETASTQLPDADMKAFAAKTLPMLRQHLAEIQTIAAKMNIATE